MVLPDRPAVAAMDCRGGGPGTRESDALSLASTVSEVHGVVLSGGSAFGLSAATGVQSWLAARGHGFDVGGVRIPIVPQAILFDLLNGGDKDWGATPPFEHLALAACDQAGKDFALGSVGAGFGATTATLRGGLGSASAAFDKTIVVAALVAVNAVGSATIGTCDAFWAAPFEVADEFGAVTPPNPWPHDARNVPLKGGPLQNTTLGVIATNAPLTRPQAHRIAVMAQTGLARALYPVHTPLDGDVVFALSTGQANPPAGAEFGTEPLARLGALGADVMARAVARGIYLASPAPARWQGPPAWQTKFGSSNAS